MSLCINLINKDVLYNNEKKNCYRVEELFKLVEEELTADQVGGSLNHTPSATQPLKRETTMEALPLEANGWPKTEAVIDFAKKRDDKEKTVKEDAIEVSRLLF